MFQFDAATPVGKYYKPLANFTDRDGAEKKRRHGLYFEPLENARLWAEEAERRDRAWDADPAIGIPAAEVFRDARARLK